MAGQNGGKQRSKGRSNSVDERKPRVVSQEKKDLQLLWRIEQLKERQREHRLTEKNIKEMDAILAIID